MTVVSPDKCYCAAILICHGEGTTGHGAILKYSIASEIAALRCNNCQEIKPPSIHQAFGLPDHHMPGFPECLKAACRQAGVVLADQPMDLLDLSAALLEPECAVKTLSSMAAYSGWLKQEQGR